MSILNNQRNADQFGRKTSNSSPKTAPQSSSSGKRSFNMIPSDDLIWAMEQKPAVIRLFHECWLCDPYGSRWMQLNTKLKDRAFRDAKKKISDQGLFIFKRETSIQDSRSTVCWIIKNLHGSRVKGYWEDCKAEFLGGTDVPDCGMTMPDCSTAMPEYSASVPVFGTAMPPISPQIQSEQGFQNRSISFQYHINDQQQFNIAEDGVVADLSEAGEEPTGILEDPQPDPITKAQRETVHLLDKREIFDSLRLLGIETNERVRATMKKHAANVPSAIAHIKQRYDNREKFGNITGAFVEACRKGAKPRSSVATWGLDIQNNPPTEQQLQALEDARGGRLILDYFFSSLDNTYKVILLDGITQVPWWQYLDI